MFFEKAIEKIKQAGFVKSDGQDDFEQFLIEERTKEMTAQEMFEDLKNKKYTMSDNDLDNIYDNALALMSKFERTGQIKSMKKLMFVIDTLTKEKQLLDLGVDTYVIKDDIEEYIEKIAKNEVSFVELERYERDIPEDVVKKIEELKNIVPKFYILFTDYTHKLQKKLQKETEVARDPIIFGVFEDNIHINERFYFIADWVDEYCDLTFDKFVSAFQRDVSYKSTSPDKLKDLHAYLDSLELRNGKYVKKQSYKPRFLERLKNAYRYLVGKTSNIYINY